jgi:hypothetical protein
MCFFTPPKPPPQIVPAAPATPLRSGEENKAAVNDELNNMRQRSGVDATVLTGGLGDAGYGANVTRKTALGT